MSSDDSVDGRGNDAGDVDSEDVDPAELQSQLSDIKGAMGLEERYPGRSRLWLVTGLLVGAAALLAQATFYFYEVLPDGAYAAIWGGFVVVAVVAVWWMATRLPTAEAPPGAPSWRALFGSLGLFLVATTGVSGQVAAAVDGLDRAVFFFGLVFAAVGLALCVTGAVLSAYRVRRRDRLVFYAGGAWTLPYAATIPHVEILRQVGVGLFGVLFALYAVAAYTALARD